MLQARRIARTVDRLGRVVIPAEFRRALAIGARTPLHISVYGERLILQRCAPTCIFCGATDDVQPFRRKPVCRQCVSRMDARDH